MNDKEKLQELTHKIVGWHKDRGTLKSKWQGQFIKMMEEATEYLEATTKEEVKDGIGDMYVVAVNFAERAGALPYDPLHERNVHIELLIGDVRSDPRCSIDMLAGLAHSHGYTLVECVEQAWDEIKDRKGKMVNDVWVKESGVSDDKNL